MKESKFRFRGLPADHHTVWESHMRVKLLFFLLDNHQVYCFRSVCKLTVKLAEWVGTWWTQGSTGIKKFICTSKSGVCFPDHFDNTVKTALSWYFLGSVCLLLHSPLTCSRPNSPSRYKLVGHARLMMLCLLQDFYQQLLGFFPLFVPFSASCRKNFFLKLCKMILL